MKFVFAAIVLAGLSACASSQRKPSTHYDLTRTLIGKECEATAREAAEDFASKNGLRLESGKVYEDGPASDSKGSVLSFWAARASDADRRGLVHVLVTGQPCRVEDTCRTQGPTVPNPKFTTEDGEFIGSCHRRASYD